jgi:hypothetical protein
MSEASRVLHARLLTDGLSDAGSIEIEDENHRFIMTLPLRAAAY